MAKRADAFRSGRFYLPTKNLSDPTTKFGNVVPAFNNNYDVTIFFETEDSDLRAFINQHGFYDQNGGAESNFSAGGHLALFCSEAVLPGSSLQAGTVDGLRQGISQKYATFRRFPDIILTYYTQTDYYTNDAFNAWMEFISPTRISSGSYGANMDQRVNTKASYRRMRYPDSYKCDMEITAFSKDITDDFSKMNETSRFNIQVPSYITYHIKNAFPTNIVAAPLAYGRPELIKTTITFTYEQFFTQRGSRRGSILRESDVSNIRGLTSAQEAQAQDIVDSTGKSRRDAQILAAGGTIETVIGD
tara:strand:+ start:205 stop:1113 length:909 start_codon:yes stop_codon:yes gene_type:complete